MNLNPYLKKDSKKVLAQYIDETGKINPKTGDGSRRFNKEGKLNAWDNKDALKAIAEILNDKTIGKLKRAEFRKQSDLPPEVRREILLKAMSTREGMEKLGQELLAPIKNVIDYEGWARKILRQRPLAQGEVNRITKDIWVVAYVVGQDGQSVSSQATGRYVYPPEFKVTAYPEVDIQDIYQMNFDVLEREQDLARQMIELKEDQALVSALTEAANAINDLVYFSSFTIGTFEDVKYQVERHRLVVDKFIMNRAEVNALIKNMHNFVDIVTERELILMGYIGTVLGSQIITTAGTGVQEVTPPGRLFAVTEGGFLGEQGIRIDLMSEPYDRYNMHESKKGWMFLELISQAIVNPRAVAMGVRV
uniref:Phage major capsid protein n=1 Tax=candidate division CPR3 bacterium TaxID=2268181 RepID=A0A7V3N5V1_UNCC3